MNRLGREITWQVPDNCIERNSVYGLATYQFLFKLDGAVLIHQLNCKERYNSDVEPPYFISNFGEYFENEDFVLHSYDWSEGIEGEEDPNLPYPNADCFLDKRTGAALSWYKYAPRGLRANDAFMQLLEDDEIGEVLLRLCERL